MWGELAWQLGAKEGYAMVRSADEKAVSPGDSLRLLFNKYAPCLILIDEWVANPGGPTKSFQTITAETFLRRCVLASIWSPKGTPAQHTTATAD
jgi:hypothetical protein